MNKLAIIVALYAVTCHATSCHGGDAYDCISIVHIGPEDYHVKGLVITSNKSAAAKYGDSYFDDWVIVDDKSYKWISDFLASKQKAYGWTRSSEKVAKDIGTFEITERDLVGKSVRYCCEITPSIAIELFDSLVREIPDGLNLGPVVQGIESRRVLLSR